MPMAMGETVFLGRSMQEWLAIDRVLALYKLKDANDLERLIETLPRKPDDWSGY